MIADPAKTAELIEIAVVVVDLGGP